MTRQDWSAVSRVSPGHSWFRKGFVFRLGGLLLMLLGTPAVAQAVFVPETALLCHRAAAVRLLSGLAPPGLGGVPGTSLASPTPQPESFTQGGCIWLAPNTSLVRISSDRNMARVRMNGQPVPFYVLESQLVAGVGATPTPSADPEADHVRQSKQAYERFFATVRQRLALTSTQQPLFEAYARAVLDQQAASARLDGRFTLEMPEANALRRLELRQEGMQFEADRLRQLVSLFGHFYAALTPEQQKTADELLLGANG